jgi:hypothetical protein
MPHAVEASGRTRIELTSSDCFALLSCLSTLQDLGSTQECCHSLVAQSCKLSARRQALPSWLSVPSPSRPSARQEEGTTTTTHRRRLSFREREEKVHQHFCRTTSCEFPILTALAVFRTCPLARPASPRWHHPSFTTRLDILSTVGSVPSDFEQVRYSPPYPLHSC